jgi:gliding motility-associated-like protein
MKFFRTVFLVAFLFFVHEKNQAQTITTFAGTGNAGSVLGQMGDGGPAINADITNPTSICFDSKGNMFLACGNFIRRIDGITHIITTIAGVGEYGFSGDGGPATNARIQSAYGMCVDKFDNIYFTDHGGHRVRKINPAGIISTIAGNGNYGFSGDGGPAVQATLSNPRGLCADANGNIYICDSDNSRIRKVNQTTGIITTYIGIGNNGVSNGDGGLATQAAILYPADVKFDHHGNLLFVEVNVGFTCRLRKVDTTSGIISTMAGSDKNQTTGDGGAAINASLTDPSSVCVDRNNNIFITQFDDSRIRKIDAITGIITTVAGKGTSGFSGDGGSALNAEMNKPSCVIFDAYDNMFVADSYNYRVRLITGLLSATCSPQLSISSTATSICKGNPVSFTAYVNNSGVATPSYKWFVNANDVYDGGQIFTTANLSDQDVITCRYVSTSGCVANVISTNNIVMHVAEIPQIKLSKDTIVYLGNKVLLNPIVVSNDPVHYLWTPSIWLDNDTIQTPTTIPQSTITYQLQVITSNDCKAVASIDVLLLNVKIPNAFSPNGDNVNDKWMITGLTGYKNCTVDVFNRNGQPVFHSNGYNEPWDGTYKGKPLSMGTYYYVIDPHNGIPSFSGSLTILK